MRTLLALLLAACVALAPARAAEPPLALPPGSLEPVLGKLTTDRLFETADVGLQVVDVLTGEEVFAWHPDRPMSPASTMKAITAAAALRHLGPAYKFTTRVTADGPIDGSGTLKGNLYVRGSGDPHFVVERLWKLVYDVKLAGVQRIEGDVVFDEGFFDTSYPLPGWSKQADIERGPSYFPTLGALSLNFNTAALVVAPGPALGHAGRVVLETPASEYVRIVNQVTTAPPGGRRWVKIDRDVVDGTMRFTVRGSVPADARAAKYYRTVADPTSHFAAAWADMMRAHDVEVTGHLRRGPAPEDAALVAEHVSPPLATILMDMNKYSNNFMAEQVLKALGAEVKGGPGTTAKGLEVVDEYLRSIGVDPGAYRLVNGSGLSRDIRLQPSVLTAVLVDMAHDARAGQEFLSSMAIAGVDGTLLRRLEDAPGRLRGKTGTIDGVHCLAGYVDGADGRRYAFAFMVNDLPGSAAQAKLVHDRFARQLFGSDGEDGVVEELSEH